VNPSPGDWRHMGQLSIFDVTIFDDFVRPAIVLIKMNINVEIILVYFCLGRSRWNEERAGPNLPQQHESSDLKLRQYRQGTHFLQNFKVC
jgi:hypothetical protein